MQNKKLTKAATNEAVNIGNQSRDGKLYKIGMAQMDAAFKRKKV